METELSFVTPAVTILDFNCTFIITKNIFMIAFCLLFHVNLVFNYFCLSCEVTSLYYLLFGYLGLLFWYIKPSLCKLRLLHSKKMSENSCSYQDLIFQDKTSSYHANLITDLPSVPLFGQNTKEERSIIRYSDSLCLHRASAGPVHSD